MTSGVQYSGIDMMCICIVREIKDGELMQQGISTPLVRAAYMLAKLTHAPNSVIYYIVGNLPFIHVFPLSLQKRECNRSMPSSVDLHGSRR